MLYTIEDLLIKFNDYNSPYTKISREVSEGKLIKLKRGLYLDDPKTDPYAVAQYLYSPSYISFETALYYRGMIPDVTVMIKSATLNKRRSKLFQNKLGTYTYQDIPERAFPFAVDVIRNKECSVLIASKEKSLTDMLYKLPQRRSMKDIEIMLFDDLRINEMVFDSLDHELLGELCDLYCCINLNTLKKYLLKQGLIKNRSTITG